jgi:hypothetical protein
MNITQNRPVQDCLVEIDGKRRAEQGADDGRGNELRTALETQYPAAAKRRNRNQVLHQQANAVSAVGDVGGKPEQDQDGQRDQRAAARQRIDVAGDETHQRYRGVEP